MKLTSSEFLDSKRIPIKYTCDGINISPPLMISDVPIPTKSLVLIVDDPDAVKATGKVWDHWVVFNIPPETVNIKEGENPKGIIGKDSRGLNDYSGPCPPDGEHRYFFKVFALDKMLDLKHGSSKTQVEIAMKGHIIEEAVLMGTYKRI
ncbi:MAG: YbhB/YbcL family Raf kinase inhibitor-like protein [Nanoarchaeota archaeon]